jgi:repressor LexA
VAAGSPILAIENMLGRYPVDPALFSPRADYLLQVSGLSMRDDGILDGDWLVVHRTTQARNGQIVVARIGEEVTVKRLKMRGRKAELIPANPDYKTLHLDLDRDTLAIEGVAVGVIRNLNARA